MAYVYRCWKCGTETSATGPQYCPTCRQITAIQRNSDAITSKLNEVAQGEKRRAEAHKFSQNWILGRNW